MSGSVYAQYYGVSQTIVGQWSAGVQVGSNYLRGDVPTLLPALQGGVYAQHSFTQSLDLKLMFEVGQTTGLSTTPNSGFLLNSALNGETNPDFGYDSTQSVYDNFAMTHFMLSGVIKVNLNRLIQPQADGWDVYLLGGLGMMLYETRIDAYNESAGTRYDYSQLEGSDPVQIRNQLQTLRDGTYETAAQQDFLNTTRLLNRTLRSNAIVGAGLRVRLGDKVGLGLEGRYHLIADDLLDGQQWTDNNEASSTSDHLITAGLTLDYIF